MRHRPDYRRVISAITLTALGAAGLNAWASPALAAVPTAYVAATGSNAGPNTCANEATPCATVTHALTQATSNPTIHIRGTVVENIVVPGAINWLALIGDGANATLDGNATGRVIQTFAPMVVTNLTIRNGATTTEGGGIRATSDLALIDSRVEGNRVTSSSGRGGGVNVSGGTLTVRRSTFANNSAGDGGAVYTATPSSARVSASTFTANSASSGGALFLGDSATIERSTFTANSATWGSTLWNPKGVVRVLNSTITNEQPSDGGALHGTYGSIQVGGSILGPSTHGLCSGEAGVVSSLGYNLLVDGTCGPSRATDLHTSAPLLGTLGNNGGPTDTIRVLPGSPALNAIPVGTTVDGVVLCARNDQRGMAGPVTGAAGCAAGAIESSTFAQRTPAALAVSPTSGVAGTELPLTFSGDTVEDASYVATDGTAAGCTLSDTTLTASTGGTCVVTGTSPTMAAFTAISTSTTITLRASQAPLERGEREAVFATPFTLTASGGSGTGAITYTAENVTATGCSVTGNTLTSTSTGICSVTATRAADATFLSNDVTWYVEFERGEQTPFGLATRDGVATTGLRLLLTGGSGTGELRLTASEGTAECRLDGTILTAAKAGWCDVTATKAGDANYLNAETSWWTVTFTQAPQKALSLTSRSGTVGTPLALTSTGGSGTGLVTFTATNGTAAGCAVAANRLSATRPGTCLVTVSRAGDETYLDAASAPTAVTFSTKTPAVVRPGKVSKLKVAGKARATKRVVTWKAPAGAGLRYDLVVTNAKKRVLFRATVSGTKATLKRSKLAKGTLTATVTARSAAGAGAATKVKFTVKK